MGIVGLADHLPLKDGAFTAGNADALLLDGAAVTCTLVTTVALLLGPTPWLAVPSVGFPWELVTAVHLPILLIRLTGARECGAACRAGIESLTSVHKRLEHLLAWMWSKMPMVLLTMVIMLMMLAMLVMIVLAPMMLMVLVVLAIVV
jgi:hypothetical protein